MVPVCTRAPRMRIVATLFAAALLAGCVTDAATRLAYDLEGAAGRVAKREGAGYTLVHQTASSRGECTGPYKVQLDQVGLIVFWCKDAAGAAVVSSHSTSYHRRFVSTAETFILDKRAGEALTVQLERRGGVVVITAAR